MAEFAHNNWTSETTGESPFKLLMGYHPHADWTDKPSPLPQVTRRLEEFKKARRRAQELMIKAQSMWVKHKDTPKYKEGCNGPPAVCPTWTKRGTSLITITLLLSIDDEATLAQLGQRQANDYEQAQAKGKVDCFCFRLLGNLEGR